MQVKLKPCEMCKKKIKLTKANASIYYRRKTCSQECKNRLIQKRFKDWWVYHKKFSTVKLLDKI